MKTIPQLLRYVVPPFSVMDTSWISQIVSKASKERARHIEMMAAAFIKETKIPVRHVELIEEHRLYGAVYYYRDKRDRPA
jgi:hypothetical protein